MAHRGRLNVLAHTVGLPYESVLAEFEGEQRLDADTLQPSGGTGDVKYHYGASGTYRTQGGKAVTVAMAPNPSHLEYVNPVIEGRARADQTTRKGREPAHDPSVVVPVLLHGDAAFPGQGVVAETLNLQALAGYSTGGTIHIITNNQLGFTTDPSDARSTRYASDLAKGYDVPIIHVNADDVEACVHAIRLAMAFRARVRPRRADRPDRLPPLRPQRDRRAGVHAARDVRADQAAPARARRCTRTAWWPRAPSPPRMRRSSPTTRTRGCPEAHEELKDLARRATRRPASTSSTGR